MRTLSRITFCLLLAGSSLARAQNGDVATEVQNPPPADLQIPPAPVLVAEEALKTIKVAPGYRLEIAAADPLIGDPVAATFGPDGRLWVVEMRAFMPNPDGQGEDAKVGTVAVLEDTDHDGRFDRRTVFLDGLVLPRAITLVDDGVLVAEPPHLWFCRDTNGDGRADEKTEIASDYGTPDNPEHSSNGLYRALDNWIYSANHTVRFRYLGGGKFARENTIFRGQWGISQDDAGRLFYNTNSDPLRFDLVPSQYFARNPGLPDPASFNLQLVPANLRIWPLRVTPGVNRGYKSLDATGRITAMTAACAPFIQRGDSLPELRGDAFVCEPSGNLIKRIPLAVTSDELGGRNGYEGEEFIASTDERFRPVNLAAGPDGTFYIVDMYHGIIQHRIYLTTYLRNQIEARCLADGNGMGRIYRVVPALADLARPAPFDLTKESTSALVARLNSRDGWWRDTAQRLLVERRDDNAVPLLRQLALDLKAPNLARLHALWTLEGVEASDAETLRNVVANDPDPTVCAAAIRLGEKFLSANDPDYLLWFAVPRRVDRAAYEIVLQQALSFGVTSCPQGLAILCELARRHGARPYIAEAIVSGLAGREGDFLALILRDADAQLAPLAALAAASAWRTGDAAQLQKINALFATSDLPEWTRTSLLASIRAVIPLRDKQPLSVLLSAAPDALIRLAESADAPQSAEARELLAHVRWPGHDDEANRKLTPLTAEQQQLFEKGRTIFTTICAGCHQPTGLGLKGLAPALVNSKWVAGDERALVRIVLQGKTGNGLIMPPLQSLDDGSLAGVLTFLRRSWGHGFDPVAPAALVTARHETAGRAEPWTDKELTALITPAPSALPSSPQP